MRVIQEEEKEQRDESTGNENGIPDAGNAKNDSGTYRKRTYSQRMVPGKKLFGRIILLLAKENPGENIRHNGNKKRDSPCTDNDAKKAGEKNKTD